MIPFFFYLGLLLFPLWTFVWLAIRNRSWRFRWSVDDVDQLLVGVAFMAGLGHFMILLDYHIQTSQEWGNLALSFPHKEQIVGEHWFAFWMYPLTYAGLFLFSQIESLRTSRPVRIGMTLWLLLLLHLEKIVIFITSFHRDYVSSL